MLDVDEGRLQAELVYAIDEIRSIATQTTTLPSVRLTREHGSTLQTGSAGRAQRTLHALPVSDCTGDSMVPSGARLAAARCTCTDRLHGYVRKYPAS